MAFQANVIQHAVIIGAANEAIASTVVGTTGQVLKGNTGADPTWGAPTSFTQIVIQTFTTTGTYTPTSGMKYCIIEAIGGGGAGGGAVVTGAGQVSGGSGGGSGEYARGAFSAATIGVSQSVTIGNAGTANSGASGGAGGNTSVGSTLISANGGSGGVSTGVAATVNANGGLGGTGGTGGQVRTPGQAGLWALINVGPAILNAGTGGSSVFGAGGRVDVTGVANQGSAGLGNGSGGGGSSNFSSQAAPLAGGAGTKGIVVITEYI